MTLAAEAATLVPENLQRAVRMISRERLYAGM
jgi:hypothetical protein